MQTTVEGIPLTFDGNSSGLYVRPIAWDWMIPAGSLIPFAGINRPAGWLLADGTAVSRATYAHLFDVIGTTYGSGDGSTTFNLPNLKGKVVVGFDATQTEFNTLNKTGGEKEHTLTISEMPIHSHTGAIGSTGAHNHTGTIGVTGAHSHSINDPGHTHTWNNGLETDDSGSGGSYNEYTRAPGTVSDSIASNTTGISINSNGDHSHSLTIDSNGNHSHPITIDNNGGGAAHNNLQPYTTLYYIIKY